MTNVTLLAGFLAEAAGVGRATLRKQSRLDMETLQKAVVSRSPGFRSARHTMLFARNFLKYPQMLGSVIPSSPFLVNQLLARFEWRRASVVVEYGPGIGNITREILRRMRPDAVLVAIELNPDFVRFLRAEIDDPRLRVVEGSALDIRESLARLHLPMADYVISGIPFSTIPHERRSDILRESREMLRSDGAMLVYQFRRTVLPYLKRHFGRVQEDFAFLNILPARIFHCTM
jgi:phospholipid N-methyltransferase